MGWQPVLLVCLAHPIAHVGDEVDEQKVTAWEHISKLLGHAIEAGELRLDVNPFVGLHP